MREQIYANTTYHATSKRKPRSKMVQQRPTETKELVHSQVKVRKKIMQLRLSICAHRKISCCFSVIAHSHVKTAAVPFCHQLTLVWLFATQLHDLKYYLHIHAHIRTHYIQRCATLFHKSQKCETSMACAAVLHLNPPIYLQPVSCELANVSLRWCQHGALRCKIEFV